MEKIGLVLEGGGMRGVFTSGVLDFFIEQDLYLKNVYGISAGACNAVSYVAKQKGRNKKINMEYCHDKRYVSFTNFLKYKSMFGMKFIFEDLPHGEVPFDYDTYYASNANVFVGATNLLNGQAEFFSKDEAVRNVEVLKASCALPIVSAIVHINGVPYLDGGIADSIPIQKSIEDGNEKNIIILTQDVNFQKKPSSNIALVKRMYRNYPHFIEAYCHRHEMYNAKLSFIKSLEQEGKVFVFRPSNPVSFKRFEKDEEKLEALYEDGYHLAGEKYKKLCDFLR